MHQPVTFEPCNDTAHPLLRPDWLNDLDGWPYYTLDWPYGNEPDGWPYGPSTAWTSLEVWKKAFSPFFQRYAIATDPGTSPPVYEIVYLESPEGKPT